MRFSSWGLAVGSTVLLVTGVFAVGAGCGSDSSCEETRSCSGSGGAGTGGGAGDSGSDAPVSCDKNEDCENGLVCDGVATCVEHVCVPGTPVVCSNPDPAHCTPVCVEPSGTCEVSASDVDGDEHLDPLCTDATVTSTFPADDCDDAVATVHPGADEICDGLDNDCNDKADLADGLTISGASQDFVSSEAIGHPAIAWSSTAQKYGVVWEDNQFVQTGDEEISFALMNPDGTKSGADVRVSNAVDQSSWPRIAAGNASFGVVWGDTRGAGIDIYFRRFSDAGAALTPEKQITPNNGTSEVPDIISIPDGWLVVFEETAPANQIYGVRIDLDGNIVKPKTLIGSQTGKNALPRIAAMGNEFGMLWSKLGSTTEQFRVEFLRADFDFNVTQGEVDVSPVAGANTGGVMGDIAANAANDGFLIAYYNYQVPTNLAYGELTGYGSASCGPTAVGSAITQGAVGEIVPYSGGSAFIHTKGVGPSADVSLAAFGAGCSGFTSTKIDTTATSGINSFVASAASGEAGVALVWEDALNGKIRTRVMGPHLCD